MSVLADRGLVVVKCGGAASALAPERVVLGLVDRGHPVCVVHGAGPQITEEMERRGLAVRFVEGRRYTTPEALDVVRGSLLQVNADLVAAIGPAAVGLAGDEIGLEATRIPELGLVGEPVASRPERVVDALARGRIPVVAPLATGPLNVNADDAAVALAAGLGAERLLFVTDVPGVLVDGSVAPSLDADEADAACDAGVFQGGIVPKLRAAARAARLGIAAEIGATRVLAGARAGSGERT